MSRGQELELDQHLVIRDLLSSARHALDMCDGADAVTVNFTLDHEGLALSVSYLVNGQQLAGWGQ